ncbi:MAG TPA: phosphate signaling complex protein PhoU [Verrucomicrobiae bacterium]|nr:phosphate signaling complex protein PhoU [Verrucomicrobiae bacterium]
MERHFHEELKGLKQRLLEMSFKVEEAVSKACDALFSRDGKLAEEVIREETAINTLEIEVDQKGHNLFVRGQPMAVDLRLITMVLKINTDLERMGDHAVNIAEKTLFLLQEPELPLTEPLEKMARSVQTMFRDAVNAFMREDPDLALAVLKRDDEVDDSNAAFYYLVSDYMEADSKSVNAGINYLMISHNLERIADLACNIAEDVIYLKQGKEVRHRIQMGGRQPAAEPEV